MSTSATATGRLVLHQTRSDLRIFFRNPASVFFTFLLPLIFLFLFTTIFGNAEIEVGDTIINGATYYVPSILSLSIISATVVSLSFSLVVARDRGILKRVEATPLPRWVFLAGQVVTRVIVALMLMVIVLGIGAVVYGVAIPTTTMPAVIVTLIVGAAAGCSLGFAMTLIIPNEDAAAAVTNGILLPLYFISGIFIPESELQKTEWLLNVAALFPVRHLFNAMLAAFDPSATGLGFSPWSLFVLVLWGMFGAVMAVWKFRYTPKD